MEFPFNLLIIVLLMLGVRELFKRWFSKRRYDKGYSWPSEKIKLKEDFFRIFNERKNFCFVIIEFGAYYFQYQYLEEYNEIYCEAVANEFLKDTYKLTSDKEKIFFDLKFVFPDEKDSHGAQMPNFSKLYKFESDNDLVLIFDEFIDISKRVYELQDRSFIRLHFERNS